MFEILGAIYFIGVVLSYRMMYNAYEQCSNMFLIRKTILILGIMSWLTLIVFVIGQWVDKKREFAQCETHNAINNLECHIPMPNNVVTNYVGIQMYDDPFN